MTRTLFIALALLAAAPAAARPVPHSTSWTDHNASDPGITMIAPSRPRPRH